MGDEGGPPESGPDEQSTEAAAEATSSSGEGAVTSEPQPPTSALNPRPVTFTVPRTTQGGRWSLDSSHALTMLVAGAPVVGLTVAYGYLLLLLEHVVNTADLDIGVTAIAPSAGLVVVCLTVGGGVGDDAYSRRTHLRDYLRSVVGGVAATFVGVWAIALGLGMSTGIQVGVVLAIGFLAGVGYGALKGGDPGPHTGALVGVAVVALMASIGILGLVNKELIRNGAVSSVGRLPMNMGGTVRYVRVVSLVPQLAELDDAVCAVSFGVGNGGDRVIRLVRPKPDGNGYLVELWFINPQMVALSEQPPCPDPFRNVVWNNSVTNERRTPAPVSATTTASVDTTTSAPTTVASSTTSAASSARGTTTTSTATAG